MEAGLAPGTQEFSNYPTDAKQLIKDYLSQGVPQHAVATAVGVSESYVAQLMSQEDFAEEVGARRTQVSKSNQEVDDKIREGEKTALERILQKLPMANLQMSLQVFKVLNSAKLRKESVMPNAAGVNPATVVEIHLPGAMVPQYVQNRRAEIIEVDGQTMVSAGAKQLERLAAARIAQLSPPEQSTVTNGTSVTESSDQRAADMLQLMHGLQSGAPAEPPNAAKRARRLDLKSLLEKL